MSLQKKSSSPKCYIYNALKPYSLPSEILDKEQTLFYPEKTMTFEELMNARPFAKNIVTDSPFLVPLFDFEDVYIYAEGEWKSVCEEIGFQTFGTSYEIIMDRIFDFSNSIPLFIINSYLK